MLFLKHSLTIFVFSAALLSGISVQAADRKVYVKSAYEALNSILKVVITSEAVEDEHAHEFLVKASTVLTEHKPHLEFVNDSDQFLMEEGMRLMRSHPEPSKPIFINEKLLNSDSFRLNLPQLLKLLLHEVGHKTQHATVAERDRWSQSFENLLSSSDNYTRVVTDEGKTIESLSLSPELIQVPLHDNPYRPQNTFWLYSHDLETSKDWTPELFDHINKNATITRTLGIEILTAITEVANAFKGTMQSVISKAFNPILESFNVNPPMPLPEDPLQGMTLVKISRIAYHHGSIVLDAHLAFTRSLREKMGFSATGMPWVDYEEFPVQIRLSPEPSMYPVAKVNYKDKVKVSGVIRQDGKVQFIDVKFRYPQHPFGLELGVMTAGGIYRLPAASFNMVKPGLFKARFDLAQSRIDGLQYADRIYLEYGEIQLFDRQIEIEESTKERRSLTKEDVIPDSFGVWGVRHGRAELEKAFSHFNGPVLFWLVPPNNDSLTIDPFDLNIEFEVAKDLKIAQAELLWTSEPKIFDTSDSKDYPIISVTENWPDGEAQQRYAGAGKLIARTSLREAILFNPTNMVELPSSKPGFKKVQMRSATRIKYAGTLQNDNQAHGMPQVTPVGIRILTKDHGSYMHHFPNPHGEEFLQASIKRPCGNILDLMQDNAKK